MDLNNFKDKLVPFIKKYWLSAILALFSWFILKQFYLAIRFNIFYAVLYDQPFGFGIIYFLMDNLTLIIHEAGHTIFGIFGWRFLTILGGTLMQMLIPFLIVIWGWFNKKQFIIQASLYWLGFAWIDSAAYADDTLDKAMPLIGNLPKSAHDFGNLLSSMNLLEQHATVAWIMYSIGLLILLFSVIYPVLIPEETEYINLDLKL